MGRPERFADVFEFLMKLSAERPITLFIDEFQEFFRVNKSVFCDTCSAFGTNIARNPAST